MNLKRPLILILLFVFVDVLGFSLILPLLPFYAAEFNASSVVVGMLIASNAVTKVLGAPVLGRLSDRFGRKPLLVISIAGTLVSFLILGWAGALWMLFLGRMLDGLLGGNVSLAQAYISDSTEKEERTDALGLIGASFGLGFIIGPALGGVLSAGGNYALPSFAAAGLAAVNLAGVLLWLPESLPPEARSESLDETKGEFSLQALVKALRRPCVGPLLIVVLIYGLAFTMFETMFSLFAQKKLGLTAQTTSFVLAYVGVLIVLMQGVGIRFLTDRFRDKELIFAGAGVLALGLVGWGLSPSLPWLLASMVPLSLASGMLRVSLDSALTKSVYQDEVGGLLGLSSSLNSFTRVVSPLLGSLLLAELAPAAPGLAGALLMVGVVYFTWDQILHVPDIDCEPAD